MIPTPDQQASDTGYGQRDNQAMRAVVKNIHPTGRSGPLVGLKRLKRFSLPKKPDGVGSNTRAGQIGGNPGQQGDRVFIHLLAGENNMGDGIHLRTTRYSIYAPESTAASMARQNQSRWFAFDETHRAGTKFSGLLTPLPRPGWHW